MAILALLGRTILLENRYSPVIAVKEEIAWNKERRNINKLVDGTVGGDKYSLI